MSPVPWALCDGLVLADALTCPVLHDPSTCLPLLSPSPEDNRLVRAAL